LEFIEIMKFPLLACIVLAGMHCYLGLHVVMREVIFVDLALAQIAAMGAAVGLFAGSDPDSIQPYFWSLGFTFIGAAMFSIARFRDQRVPQEAIIGIVYAVSSAIAILVLSKSAVEGEQVENMLKGQLIFVGWPEIIKLTLVCVAVAVVHVIFRKPLFAVSGAGSRADQLGVRVWAWDLLFYMTFGLVITSAVQIAGVLLVFSFLIAPAICAMLFMNSITARLLMGWTIGMIATVLGLAASYHWDTPAGVSIVAAFGLILAICVVTYALVSPRHAKPEGHAAS